MFAGWLLLALSSVSVEAARVKPERVVASSDISDSQADGSVERITKVAARAEAHVNDSTNHSTNESSFDETLASKGHRHRGPDCSWIPDVYRTVLCREPDAGGLHHWTGYCQRGTPRSRITHWISTSHEYNHCAKCKNNCVELPPPSPPPPVNCAGRWEEWGSCSALCGEGEQTRDYFVTTPAAHGGQACPSPETRSCNTHGCIITQEPTDRYQSCPASFSVDGKTGACTAESVCCDGLADCTASFEALGAAVRELTQACGQPEGTLDSQGNFQLANPKDFCSKFKSCQATHHLVTPPTISGSCLGDSSVAQQVKSENPHTVHMVSMLKVLVKTFNECSPEPQPTPEPTPEPTAACKGLTAQDFAGKRLTVTQESTLHGRAMYTYEITIGEGILQKTSNAGNYKIGRHKAFNGMKETFSNGDSCGRRLRSATINYVFGPTLKLLKAREPSMCIYEYEVQIPTSDCQGR